MANLERRKRWDGFVTSPDPAIWGRLPSDVQIKLLEYLPLPSLCRFQAVCRTWYRAVRSLKEVTVHGKCYIKAGENSGCLSICSTLEHGWLNLPLDYLPSELRESACLVSTCPTGLICLHGSGYNGRATIVSNLLTRSWTRLPEPPEVAAEPDKDLRMFLGMQNEDEDIGCSEASFIVVYVKVRWRKGTGWSETFLQVYQSRKAKWESSVMDLEAGEVFLWGASYSCCCATLHGSTLYFLTRTSAGQMSLRWIDVLQKGSCCNKLSSWASLPLGMCQVPPPGGCSDYVPSGCSDGHPQLAVCAGKILLAGEHPVTRRRKCATVGLLIFNEERKEWEPFASNPHGFRAGSCLSVVGCEDRVVVCDTSWATAYVYDVKAGAWSVITERTKAMTWKLFPFELSFAGKV